jgi:diguanylate cyclase (GGDEF)-like protein
MGVEDLQSLQDLAAMVEKELEASHLSHVEKELRERLERAERQASIDPLTRAWDRTTILRILDGAFAYASRRGQPLGVVRLRLDRFEDIVETQGNRAGRVTLRIVADRTRSALRRYDSIGRYGPAEFLIVLPDADGETALRVGTRIQAKIEERPVSHGQAEIPVTGTAGVATYPGSGQCSPDALLRSAEEGTTPSR